MKCPECDLDLSESASYCPACMRQLPRKEREPSSDRSDGTLGWDTVLAGVLLMVVLLSAVLLAS